MKRRSFEAKGNSINRRQFVAKLGLACAAGFASPLIGGKAFAGQANSDYDVVILNGRVMDPESNLDSVRNIGIRKSTVQAVSTRRLQGKVAIDASGLVVAPGFIDVLAHGMDIENNRYQVHDGVTTILAMEGETADIDGWYAARAGKLILNYGASVGHGAVRRKVFGKSKDVEHDPATDAEIAQMKRLVAEQLRHGATNVGFGLEYTPGTSHWEVLEMFRVAKTVRRVVPRPHALSERSSSRTTTLRRLRRLSPPAPLRARPCTSFTSQAWRSARRRWSCK